MEETVLFICSECGSEEVNVVVNEKGAIGLFCAKDFTTLGSFPAEYDGLYDQIKQDRAEYQIKVSKPKEVQLANDRSD